MRYAEDVPGTGVWMARGVSVGTIISVAYDVKIMGRLKGLPNWTQTASYDVTAKADDATDAVLFKLSKDDFAAEKRYMLQQLLAERFHLRIRAETVQGTTYELRKTPRTATFITPVPDGKMISTCGPIFTPHKGVELHSKGCPFTYLVGDIQQDLRTEVVDATGMTGYFAYTLKWNLSSMPPPPPDEEWYPDMVHAVPEQLGLELVKTQGPITSWVVDSLERPTSN